MATLHCGSLNSPNLMANFLCLLLLLIKRRELEAGARGRTCASCEIHHIREGRKRRRHLKPFSLSPSSLPFLNPSRHNSAQNCTAFCSLSPSLSAISEPDDGIITTCHQAGMPLKEKQVNLTPRFLWTATLKMRLTEHEFLLLGQKLPTNHFRTLRVLMY